MTEYVWRMVPLLLLWLPMFLLACSQKGHQPEVERSDGPPFFVEAAASSGLDFVHFNGMSGEFYYSEMMGSGAGLLDYDNDGDLDVYLLQGHMLNPRKSLDQAIFPPSPEMLPLRDRLYRNDLRIEADGSRRLSFTDVTEESAIRGAGYGMGVATGDVNNDGWVDLYVTNAGANQLLVNRGNGTFEDATEHSATREAAWSVSAAFGDFDRDGWLDLYVVNYVDFSIESHKLCRWLAGAPDYCGPLTYEPRKDRLFHNRGDGTFEDWSGPSGILAEAAAGLGVVIGDFNRDGWPDLYVANDGMSNFLWINQGDGSFHNEALASGCALNAEGIAEAGMGVIAADFDHDGDEDLLLTHLALETNTLYRNQGEGMFEDWSVPGGVAEASWPYTSFGNAWMDFDNDGWPDVLTVSGAVKVMPGLVAEGAAYPLLSPNQLWRNSSGMRFEPVTTRAGAALEFTEVSRGVAVGDIDNDGDADALVSNNSGPVRLLLNQVAQQSPWVGLRLVGGKVDRDMLGAWVEVRRKGASALWSRVRTDGSYLSARDPRLLLGLGAHPEVEAVRVLWPGGRQETFEAQPGRYQTLREGTGKPVDES